MWRRGDVVVGTDNPVTITRSRGGSAANVAVFAASASHSRFIGRVGADGVGRALIDELVLAGVDARVQQQGHTGAIVVQISDNGERTMFPDRGAAGELADVDVNWVAGAQILHVSAYALARTASALAVVELARAARAGGALISLDAASVDLLRSLGRAEILRLIQELRPHYYFANADEARELPVDAVLALGATCLVKHGADPVTVHRPGHPVVRVAVDPVGSVRDTTGAGDAFAAGLLCALLDEVELEIAVRRGNIAAAAVLAHPGAATTTPAHARAS